MVRNNNAIPSNHFHKNWKRNVKVNFSQPMQKKKRAKLRKVKLRKSAPNPGKLLRPIVRCPTVRYHTKRRIGRGFSLDELKQMKLTKQWAKSIGIAVDYRRRSKSIEARLENVQRLREFAARLILFPFKRTLKKEAYEKLKATKIISKEVNILPKTKPLGIKCRKISEDEKKFQAFLTLRRARSELKKTKRARNEFDTEVGI